MQNGAAALEIFILHAMGKLIARFSIVGVCGRGRLSLTPSKHHFLIINVQRMYIRAKCDALKYDTNLLVVPQVRFVHTSVAVLQWRSENVCFTRYNTYDVLIDDTVSK